jgi:AhpD family alkylhydroperoxidase
MTAESARIDYASVFPAGVRTMVGLQRAIDAAGLEPLLLELVKTRASQINGCADCLDTPSKDARALGESEQRLHVVAAWREAPCYDARERAALAWCEHLTLISNQGPPDPVYEKLELTFSPGDIVALASRSWPSTAGTGWRYPCGHRSARTCRRTALDRTVSPPARRLGSPAHTPNRKVNHARSST